MTSVLYITKIVKKSNTYTLRGFMVQAVPTNLLRPSRSLYFKNLMMAEVENIEK